MSVTPDLKPSEFEITLLCPVGACLAQHTYAFDRELLETPSLVKETKSRVFELVDKAHKDGKHRTEATNGR